MADTASTRLRLRLQETGANVNTWGALLDTALQLIDDAVAGMTAVTLTANYTLTSANFTEDEARKAILKFSGTGAYTVTIPSVSKAYLVWNNTSGVLTISTGAGSTVSIDPTDIALVFCDGTNVKTLGYGGQDLKTYITAQTASAGAVPGTVGHLGKFLKVTSDGAAPTWQQPATTDLSDNLALRGLMTALAVAL